MMDINDGYKCYFYLILLYFYTFISAAAKMSSANSAA